MSEVANALLVNRAIITDNEQILILQRAKNDSRNAGLWEFPGGKLDAGEQMREGLTREVFEETGLEIGPTSPIAHTESEIIRDGKYKGRLYVALFYVAQKLSGEIVLSHEHSEARWEDPEVVSDYNLTPESSRALISLREFGIV